MKQRMPVKHWQIDIWKKKQMYLLKPIEDLGKFLINKLYEDPKITNFVKDNKKVEVIPI